MSHTIPPKTFREWTGSVVGWQGLLAPEIMEVLEASPSKPSVSSVVLMISGEAELFFFKRERDKWKPTLPVLLDLPHCAAYVTESTLCSTQAGSRWGKQTGQSTSRSHPEVKPQRQLLFNIACRTGIGSVQPPPPPPGGSSRFQCCASLKQPHLELCQVGHLFESLCHSLYHGRLRLVRQIGGKCLPCCETEKHSPIVAQKKRERSALSPVVNLIMQPPQQEQQQRAVRLRTDAAVPRCGWKAGLSPPS